MDTNSPSHRNGLSQLVDRRQPDLLLSSPGVISLLKRGQSGQREQRINIIITTVLVCGLSHIYPTPPAGSFGGFITLLQIQIRITRDVLQLFNVILQFLLHFKHACVLSIYLIEYRSGRVVTVPDSVSMTASVQSPRKPRNRKTASPLFSDVTSGCRTRWVWNVS